VTTQRLPVDHWSRNGAARRLILRGSERSAVRPTPRCPKVLCSVLREWYSGPAMRRSRRFFFLDTNAVSSEAASCLFLENSIASTSIFESPSYKEPTVDALAPEAEEGRGWLREATGSCRPSFDPWISEWGNPAPVMGCHPGLNKIGPEEGTGGIETSQYPEERKATATP
jgi:hypothetical protein